MTYTAFCQEADGTGTIWISSVEADSIPEAISKAVAACCEDWGGEDSGFDPGTVACLGLAEGDVKIAYWDDLA
jgi:hypothetical protein